MNHLCFCKPNLTYPVLHLSSVLISTCVYFVRLDLSSLRFYCTISILICQAKNIRQLAQKFWESMEIAPESVFFWKYLPKLSRKEKSARAAPARAAQTIALTHYGLNKYAKGLDIQP